MQKKIAIIIPTYREKVNLPKIIPLIYSFLPQSHIVIVDDNSPDGTDILMKKMLKQYKTLHFINRLKKAGRGSAVLAGFAYAKKTIHPDIYIEMDADLSHQPKELKQLLKLSKPNNIVVASRYLAKSKMQNVPYTRKLLSRMSNQLLKFVLRIPIRDNTNGFRAYQLEAIKVLQKHKFISKGYIVLSESAYLLHTKGFVFVEYPSIFINRTRGKSNTNFSEFLHSIQNVFRIKKHVQKSL